MSLIYSFKNCTNRKILLVLNFLMIFSVISLVFYTSALCATYYIDYQNGNDSYRGTSKSSPWKRCPGMVGFEGSYSHSAGDIFIFKGGVTWLSAAIPLTIGYSGTSGNVDTYTVDKTWYSGASWSQPIFDFELTDVLGITAYQKDYFTIDNIKMINPANMVGYTDRFILINDCTNVIVQNCTLDGEGGVNNVTVIELRNVDGVTLDGNYIKAKGDLNPDGILIRPWNNMKNITIKNNNIADSGGDGIHIDCESTNYDTPVFLDNYGPILIENNLFHDIGGGKMGIILIGGAKNLTIRYNKFYGVYSSGVGVEFGQPGQGYDMDGSAGGPYYWWYENCAVYYNLFYETCNVWPAYGAMVNLLHTNYSPYTANNTIYNNVFWADGSYPNEQKGIYVQSGDTGKHWTIKNNIFMGLTEAVPFYTGSPEATIDNNIYYNNKWNRVVGTNPIYTDPKFVDAPHGNFHIQSDSPAINAGLDWGQTRDIVGTPKQGLAWGIGAYEYILLPPKNLRLP
jgi:hypothetical protein